LRDVSERLIYLDNAATTFPKPPGLLGLSLGMNEVRWRGIEASHRHEMGLLERLGDGLAAIGGVDLHCATDLRNHVAVLAANVRGVHPQDGGAILDGYYGIATRVGLHCAPLVHRDLGTIERGAIRFSPGVFNTAEDIDTAVDAMRAIAAG
jgi:cysteine desulfurase / selenocysteine lyase